MIDDSFFRKLFPNFVRHDIETLIALNELVPLSPESELPIETYRNKRLLLLALEDWLQDGYDLGLLTSVEFHNLLLRVSRAL